MELHLSLGGSGRLQSDAYRQLKDAIVEGRLRPGERLPATRELAERLGVARNTVLYAYARLTAEGFVEARAGAGTFVRPDIPTKRPRAPGGAALRPRPLFRQPVVPAEPPLDTPWDLRVGGPDPTLFPWDEWRRLVAHHLRPRPSRGYYYLPPEGDPRARDAIARHVGVSRAVRAGADDVLVTRGAQQAFDLVARVLLEPGVTVAVEEPGYPPAREVFLAHGARVVPVPVDDGGIVVAQIPDAARLVYVTPSHQFPLGMPMALGRRLELLAWSRRTGGAILEDDYDTELRFDGRSLEPLQSLDRHGRVLYVGTFSKVLLPSLRLGFVVAPPSLMPALRRAKALADSHGDPAPQRALADLIDEGLLARHVRKLTRVYRERRDRLLAALPRAFGDRLLLLPSSAGLHVSALFADPAEDAAALCLRARGARVAVEPLDAYYLRDRRPGLALGYGMITASRIDAAVRKLGALGGRQRSVR